jgi:hypothetical protein
MILAALVLILAGDPVEIGVHRTPGKPSIHYEQGKPAEEIVARKDGDKILLCVRVNIQRQGLKGYTEETAPLTADEWAAIVKIVEREKLLEWTPQEQEGQVSDYGSQGLRIKTDKEHAPRWVRPILNGDRPNVLFKHLGGLAREKVKGLPLFYIGP